MFYFFCVLLFFDTLRFLMGSALQPSSVKVLKDGELPMSVRVVGYQQGLNWYADFYGVSDRTVKRWKAIGKEKGEMPPLDDVKMFVEWWSIRMKHKCPENILRLVPAEVVEPEQRLESVDLGSLEGVSDMGLSSMRQIVQVRGKAVTDAYLKGNDVQISQAEKRLESTIKTLRMLEKTASDMEKAGGDLASRSQIRSELAPMITRLSTSILEAMVKAAQKIAPEVERDRILAVCTVERDSCFNILRGELVS